MAERCPKATIDEGDIEDAPKANPTFLSPEDQTETGYSSAPLSPDLLSGAESSYWVSDDHPQEDKSRSPKHTAKPETRSSKLGFVRKPSPVKPKKAVKASEKRSKEACTAKSKLAKEPSEEACGTVKLTTSKDSSLWKSLDKPASPEETKSTPPKPESPVKKTIEAPETTSKSPEQQTKSPRKGLLAKIQSFRSPKKSEKPHVVVSLPKEEKIAAGTEKAQTPESTSARRKLLQKFTKKSPAKASEQPRFSSTDVEPDRKVEESPKKPKRASKFSPRKHKALKQDEPVPQSSKQSPVKEPVSSEVQISPASPLAMFRRGIEKMDISGRLSGRRQNPERVEETMDLITEPENVAAGPTKEEIARKEKEEILVDLPPNPPVEWRPRNRNQEGGFGVEGFLLTELSSSVEGPETPTDLTLLSDSSGVQGGSESKKGFRSDTLSKWSSMEEEVFDEGASGLQRPLRPRLQRQSNVQDLPEVDSQAATSSPGKRVPFQRQEAEDAEADDNE